MLPGTFLLASVLITSPLNDIGHQRVDDSAAMAALEPTAERLAQQGRGRGRGNGGGDQGGNQGGNAQGGEGQRGPRGGGARQGGDGPGGAPPAGRVRPPDSRPGAPEGRVRPPDSRPGPPPAARGAFRDNFRNRADRVVVVPRAYQPRYPTYAYRGFGPRYYYYDSYAWYPPAYYGTYYPGYVDQYYDTGEIRLDVSPQFADVFVDGYYAGRIDDFDGVFQALRIETGAHHIQVVAPGYEPLDFDVRIDPFQKITYRGNLIPIRP